MFEPFYADLWRTTVVVKLYFLICRKYRREKVVKDFKVLKVADIRLEARL